jgi:hypothetical protein
MRSMDGWSSDSHELGRHRAGGLARKRDGERSRRGKGFLSSGCVMFFAAHEERKSLSEQDFERLLDDGLDALQPPPVRDSRGGWVLTPRGRCSRDGARFARYEVVVCFAERVAIGSEFLQTFCQTFSGWRVEITDVMPGLSSGEGWVRRKITAWDANTRREARYSSEWMRVLCAAERGGEASAYGNKRRFFLHRRSRAVSVLRFLAT